MVCYSSCKILPINSSHAIHSVKLATWNTCVSTSVVSFKLIVWEEFNELCFHLRFKCINFCVINQICIYMNTIYWKIYFGPSRSSLFIYFYFILFIYLFFFVFQNCQKGWHKPNVATGNKKLCHTPYTQLKTVKLSQHFITVTSNSQTLWLTPSLV
jgi:hypothetical protein